MIRVFKQDAIYLWALLKGLVVSRQDAQQFINTTFDVRGDDDDQILNQLGEGRFQVESIQENLRLGITSGGYDDGKLIDSIVEIITQPYSRQRDIADALIKAVLNDKELKNLSEVKDREVKCWACQQQIRDGESVTFSQGRMYCVLCNRPRMLPSMSHCKHGTPLTENQSAIFGKIKQCEECANKPGSMPDLEMDPAETLNTLRRTLAETGPAQAPHVFRTNPAWGRNRRAPNEDR